MFSAILYCVYLLLSAGFQRRLPKRESLYSWLQHAFMGLSTSGLSELLRPWTIPSGAATSVFALLWDLYSKKKLRTATNAAAKVPSKYSESKSLHIALSFWCWKGHCNKGKTRIGADGLQSAYKEISKQARFLWFAKIIPTMLQNHSTRIRLRLALVQALMIRFISALQNVLFIIIV